MSNVRTRELLRFTLMLLGVWFVFGVFNASLIHRRALATTLGEIEWFPVLQFQICSSLLWATFTPFIIAIADALPIRRPHALRNVILLILLLPALGIARAALGGAVLNLSEGDRISVDMFKLSVAIRTHSYSLLAAIIVGATNMMRLARETGESERRQIALRTRLTRMEMDSLRAQLQPELIFRMLETIAAVIEKDAASADAMIVTLSQVIRRSLAHAGAIVEAARIRLQRLFGAEFVLDNAAMATTLRIPLLEETLTA